MAKRILVALVGNAIKKREDKGTAKEQFRNCKKTCKSLAKIISKMAKDDRLIITHGNGPQVGNLMLQQEETSQIIPAQPLDVVIAMTQGQIGYMLQQTLINCLRKRGINKPVCTILNQVIVARSLEEASKPVGNLLTKEEVMNMKEEHPDYLFKKVYPKGKRVWRRVLSSPEPVAIVESEAIRRAVDSDVIVITSGGGGIPVILKNQKHFMGVEAIVDKDLAGERLAELVQADIFLILTDVEKVKLNFGLSNERDLDMLSVSEAKEFLEKGYFPAGSMGPKVEACIRFLEAGGKKAIIAPLDKASEALEGRAGTQIYLN